ncbi:UDP-galactopyranose mutase [Agrobacterium phage OLIVR5]|uniref:UDP-galactopyranose mutase n=2 Tax=Caudoviricetes TaxID=2731619 RepID=A0A858MSS2_9CAUD|nr:UDP-galactopyranose mutase [Agrobacterium phage OLIVR5]QIW87649.1 UDP-galactopyranose mutase [Agrobacterium phage OLIVR5]QIW87908.1 UDP-galactopyranose mutase [Agrobacterium phage OLIVR6]
MKVLVVGAGFSGATVARKLAEKNHEVIVVDKRNHIAGNAYDYQEDGIHVHKYGAHIFHTPNREVWDFVNEYAEFTDYRHHVRAIYNGRNYSMPISLDTIAQFLGRNVSPEYARGWVKGHAEEIEGSPKNLEEKAISLIGRPLYEAFIKGYTMKQWNKDPKDLPQSIINRLPVRFNYNTRYFNDSYEGMPVGGYTKLIENILSHPNISVALNTDALILDWNNMDAVYYCGPIDHLFNYVHGKLEWRSVEFKLEKHDSENLYGASVTNFSDPGVEWTRAIEFKNFYPEESALQKGTIIALEKSKTPESQDEYYYPINTDRSKEILKLYEIEASKIDGLFMGGRMGRHAYYDMHQAIAIAFKDAQKISSYLETL